MAGADKTLLRLYPWQRAAQVGTAPGDRGEDRDRQPILGLGDLKGLNALLGKVEALFGWPPDVEWTGRGVDLTLQPGDEITKALDVACQAHPSDRGTEKVGVLFWRAFEHPTVGDVHLE